MSLAPGTRIGPYQLVGPLGAGGMGEGCRRLPAVSYRQIDTSTGGTQNAMRVMLNWFEEVTRLVPVT